MTDGSENRLKQMLDEASRAGKLPPGQRKAFALSVRAKGGGKLTSEALEWAKERVAEMPAMVNTKATRPPTEDEIARALAPGPPPIDADWSMWGELPAAAFQEVVALSCGIEPNAVGRLLTGSAEEKEFYRRIQVAQRTRELGRLPHTNTGHVPFVEFAEWAEGLGWKLPKEFPKPKPKPKPEEPSPVGAWPWGTYETRWLKHLAAAAEEFWVKYDPKFPATAPTSEEVVAWLVSRRVPKRMAEIMAQILRDDRLPHGPRVNR